MSRPDSPLPWEGHLIEPAQTPPAATDYRCASCGAVVAYEGDRPDDCLRCGADLTNDSEDPTQRVEATTTPEGAKGWETEQARHDDSAGGHGLDVAPDAQPEGVRAETRRWNDGAGDEPSNVPDAA